MKEKEIIESIKKSIDAAPINLIEKIKDSPKTKMIKHDDITRQKASVNIIQKFMPYVSIAAAFMLVFFGWQYQTQTPYSYIYFDVNPSVEIITNRMNKVINIEGVNTDGQWLIEDLEYRGKTINQVAEEVLDRMINEKYLDNDNKYLLLSVYNKNENIASNQKLELDENIHQHLKEKKLDPIILSQKLEKTSTIENFAKNYDISVSKMNFIKNLIILNPDLQTEKLVDLSIEELVKFSQDIELDLKEIVDSTDFEKINHYQSKDQSKVISSEQAKKIALSIVAGTITDFDFDEDDLEYEIEIELDGLEYEITIEAITGEVIELESDD